MNVDLLRRSLLGALAGASLLPLIGCSSSAMSTLDGSTGTSCSKIPEETAGPYPGDGSNGPDALGLADIVRADIRSSIGGASGVAAGVPLTVTLQLASTSGACAALAGYAVYIWHCDRDGNYSMYSAATAAENYLRGVQVAGSDGVVTFQTIFPGCYPGRWPHIHLEIFSSLTASDGKVATSQLALPEGACDLVYATSGYGTSVVSLSQISLQNDNVFRDGADLETASVSGDVASGLSATLVVGV